mmetsp:Transcript_3337/g.6970  ORF Transcript_3337/g.6970 Transcript_3337/m.6970 type:complete len:159 (+) Transcript_3337:133-609(+)
MLPLLLHRHCGGIVVAAASAAPECELARVFTCRPANTLNHVLVTQPGQINAIHGHEFIALLDMAVEWTVVTGVINVMSMIGPNFVSKHQSNWASSVSRRPPISSGSGSAPAPVSSKNLSKSANSAALSVSSKPTKSMNILKRTAFRYSPGVLWKSFAS